MYSVRIVAAIGLLASLAGGSQASEPVIPLAKMNVDGSFLGEEGKPPAIDISGMGCVPQQGDIRNCFVINDENKAAQFAVVRNNGIAIGGPIFLIGDAPDPRILGLRQMRRARTSTISTISTVKASLMRPRSSTSSVLTVWTQQGQIPPFIFILARVRVDAQGRPVDASGRLLGEKEFSSAVETTYRVTDWLKASAEVAGFFAKDLETEDGLNIEGIAVDGDQMVRSAGTGQSRHAKAKRRGERAFIVGGSVAALFSKDPAAAGPSLKSFDLSNLGIRDLAMLPDKRLLVLAGATNGPEVPFKLFVADPMKETAKPIGTLAGVTGPGKKMKTDGGKAEGVTLLDVAGKSASAVILFDALVDGSPHLAKFAIPRPD